MNRLLIRILLVLGMALLSYFFKQQSHKNNVKLPQQEQVSRQEKTSSERVSNPQTASREGNIPEKVQTVLAYVIKNHQAPEGYVGGRRFGNFENLLPKNDASGKRINYQEWDVNPKVEGRNRGTQRLITGSDGSAYYTSNHYKSFQKIR